MSSAGLLASVLKLLPDTDREYPAEWTPGEIRWFSAGWEALNLPPITVTGSQDKQVSFQVADIAQVSRVLGLSGRKDVGITLEHQGYQARIVQAEKR